MAAPVFLFFEEVEQPTTGREVERAVFWCWLLLFLGGGSSGIFPFWEAKAETLVVKILVSLLSQITIFSHMRPEIPLIIVPSLK